MRSTKLVPLLAVGLLLFAGCRDQPMPTAPDDVALTVSEDRFGGAPPFRAKLVSRTLLSNDVVHYSWELPVGSGPYETVRLHRVVRESLRPPYRPVPKMEGVMLLPGAPQLFEGIFLPRSNGSVPIYESSVALYLAGNDIDVWGMTYGWAYIPYGTTDFSFLKGWGIGKDAKHTEMALTLARWMRSTSGQGAGPIHILGFSYGGFLVYAVAGEDTQRLGNLKNVKGIIPVDGSAFKVAEQFRTADCARMPTIVDAINAGTYHIDASGAYLMAKAALDAPDELSPLSLRGIAGHLEPFAPYTFTNRQAPSVNAVGTRFLAGSYTVSPPSVTLHYTSPQRWLELYHVTPPYYPYQWQYDYWGSRCSSASYPVGFDEHLGEITVPVLHINRGTGGFFTTTLIKSIDITRLILNPLPDAPSYYGHADVFLADDAADRVWRPIMEWIKAHE